MRKYINLKVEADETDLEEFIKVCRTIQFLGAIGANREIRVRVDGDGSARFKFFIDEQPLPHNRVDTGYYGKDYFQFYIGE